jgi:hypothetical protein
LRHEPQVIALGDAERGLSMADDPAVVAHPQPDRIAPIQQSEQRLQLVVAIRPAAGDAQEQVELGRRRPAVQAEGAWGTGIRVRREREIGRKG